MNRRESIHYLTALGLLPFISGFSITNESILTRAIPNTGELLPVVGVGTWETFDIESNAQELRLLKELLQILADKGGKVIDSSPMYGLSEKTVGDLTTGLGLNDKLFLATKVWTQGKENGIQQMNHSFEVMQRKQLDLMQIHNLVDWKTHIKTLRDWKEQGKIRYIGITHYQESAYSDLENILKNEPIDFLQVNYNLAYRKAADRLLPLAREKKVAVIISQPFAYGKLFQQSKGKTLPAWAADIDCKSWAQFFLKFIVAHPAVTCVIPGTGNPTHMLDNITAGFGKLPDAKQQALMVKEIT